MHDSHTGTAAIPTSNNALCDVMIDEHSVHARELLLRAIIKRVVDLRQHTHQRSGTRRVATERLQRSTLFANLGHVEDESAL